MKVLQINRNVYGEFTIAVQDRFLFFSWTTIYQGHSGVWWQVPDYYQPGRTRRQQLNLLASAWIDSR